MGHKREDDDMLFTHYTGKVTKQEAERYFNVDGVLDAYLKSHRTPEQLEEIRKANYVEHALKLLKLVAKPVCEGRAAKNR